MTELDKIKAAKKKLDEAKQKQAELKGGLDQLMQRLKQDFGLESTDDAEKKIVLLETELGDIEAQLKDKLEELDDLMQELKD